MLGVLERGEVQLQRRPRRVRDARVVVALVLADRVLHEGRRLVDRHDDGAGGRIRLLTVVDRARLEVHGLDSRDALVAEGLGHHVEHDEEHQRDVDPGDQQDAAQPHLDLR